ncbi:TetR/AcrR family transcriptional regulator [Plastorhodobacter daqingensis]
MSQKKNDTREKILAAAAELARASGPGNISLEAVAARAGVSKGGLLYHFSSKNKLLEALVEDFLGRFDAALTAEEGSGRPNSVLSAYMDLCLRDRLCGSPPPSGLLAALAEDPGLLDPVRRYERRFLDRIRANASDPELATLGFLALMGLRHMDLLDIQVLEPGEAAEVICALRRRMGLPDPG